MALRILWFVLFSFAMISSTFAQPCDTFTSTAHTPRKFRLKDKYMPDSIQKLKEGTYLHKIDSSKYEFYRFFQNGRFFSSFVYCDMPDSTDFADTRYGWKGYYIMDGNKLNLEYFSDRYSGFVVSELTVEENELISIGYKLRGILTSRIKFPFPKQFVFVPVVLRSSPDW